ncbi:MAG: hydroxymethylglutaryl-CoA reductase, degradative [Bdellovibrionaceae bacterium]|nr:hydroxymethylglutaryl-CoA reductase, degradative [Pseudobdellovibrionaceae bacterium]|tara:strand:- start:40696 stop:42039 length:1344 start_codon:yes stop_codon:yes gene_type:complete
MTNEDRVFEKNKELFKGFSKLNREERFERLKEMGALTPEDIRLLQTQTKEDVQLAEKFIENVIGYYQMPIGVAANFVIDGKSYAIPMAVEETSIIAAASKTAKWVREAGEITTEVIGNEVIGQMQIEKVKDFNHLEEVLNKNEALLVERANAEVASGLVRRGGGVTRLSLRKLSRPDGGVMAVIHVYVDPCDAMGANIVNQVVEFLRPEVEELTDEEVTMCILSNLVDTKITRATVRLRGVEPSLMDKIQEGSIFAEEDPYRAATNNKGVLNGIDPILLATGNDWRAVEAGVHAYAAKDGQYRSITKWRREGDELVGVFEAPIIVGVVGGVTRLHPMSRMSLRMMGVESSGELSRICAAVGLVQNLGAIRALKTVGIIEGHMRLHIKNLSLSAGAHEREMPALQKKLEELLAMTNRITLSNAVDILRELRDRNGNKVNGGISQHAES